MEDSSFNSLFALNLRRYLAASNMTQVELAKKLGVGTTSVYNWCSGTKIPRMDKVDKMCRIFGCKRSDLITDGTHESDEADEFIDLYKEASPDVQQAVLLLLKSATHEP